MANSSSPLPDPEEYEDPVDMEQLCKETGFTDKQVTAR